MTTLEEAEDSRDLLESIAAENELVVDDPKPSAVFISFGDSSIDFQLRAWIDDVVEQGYVDTFRDRHPDQTGGYTWWSYIGGARDRNVGWRIDYFFVSAELMPRIQAAQIHPEIYGSDHCPISLSIV